MELTLLSRRFRLKLVVGRLNLQYIGFVERPLGPAGEKARRAAESPALAEANVANV